MIENMEFADIPNHEDGANDIQLQLHVRRFFSLDDILVENGVEMRVQRFDDE
jgi:hypothetical protein